MKLIFEKSKPGLTCLNIYIYKYKNTDASIPANLKRKKLANLPEIAEIDLIRHYIGLSKKNIGVDNQFYPLGSCTMKYNPKINEEMASLEGFTSLHPLCPENFTQGALQIMYETEKMLSAITGMDSFSLHPAAGAHGEITGIMIIKAYHLKKGNKKTKIIIPDSAHGTNPSSAALCGYNVITIKSNPDGCVDIKALKEVLDENTAGLMMTNPNTLGLFEKNILEISKIVHDAGGLLYYDGANLNAIMGKCKPADMGFDVMHVNLHKTFSTPHGCGGPGSGPVGVKKQLADFLPVPTIIKKDNNYSLCFNNKDSIGKIISFYGNFLIIVRAYVYMKLLGKNGLKEVSEIAVLNANYIKEKLKKYYHLAHDKTCMHEFVLSSKKQNEFGIHAMDIAKCLIDMGFHPPTVYFPLIVDEAIMIEPTETESKETLDKFIDAMIKISELAKENPDKLHNAPITTPVQRLDEVKAARQPILKFCD